MGKYGPTVLLGVTRRMLEMQSPSDLESHIEWPIAPHMILVAHHGNLFMYYVIMMWIVTGIVED